MGDGKIQVSSINQNEVRSGENVGGETDLMTVVSQICFLKKLNQLKSIISNISV
jgi:hypothetical protein